MAVGIKKTVVVYNGIEMSQKVFRIIANKKIKIRAIYHPNTPENQKGHAKWIVAPKKDGPFTKGHQSGNIGDSRSISLEAKYCGPKKYVIEAFMTKPENKYPAQLVFLGVAPEKIINTRWSLTNGGKDIGGSTVKYGQEVWLNVQTEGLNGAVLEIDVYNKQSGDDKKVCTIPYVQCMSGEVNHIINTSLWRATTGWFVTNDEKFYIKIRKRGSSSVIKANKKDNYLLIEDKLVRRVVVEQKSAKPVKVGKSEVNVERYDLCRFTKIAITEKGKNSISLFEEGRILSDKQKRTEFQASQTIYFDFDKWNVKNETKKVLNGLIDLLLDNPYVPSELGAHCDSRGDDYYNDNLSKKRAIAVVDYLVTKGISRNNIRWKGYGKRRPVIPGDPNELSEAEHKENRRVTIKFLISGGDAESIVYETIAGGETKPLDIKIDITDYVTEQCLRKNDTARKHEANNLKIIELTSDGKNGPYTKDGSKPVNYKVYSSLSKSRFIPFDYILPHKSKTNLFKFYINSCRYYANKTKAAILIKVYPDIKWDFHFYAKLSNPLAVKWQGLSKANDTKMRKVNGKIAAQERWKQTEAAFGAVLKASWNKIDELNYDETKEITAKYEDKFKTLYNLFSSLKNISKGITAQTKGKATKVLGSKQPFEVEIIPPNICFGAEWMLARGSLKQKAIKEIGTEIKVYLKAEPLIGLKLIIDLLDIALKGASMMATGNTVAADIFIRVKKWASKGYESENVEISFDMWIDLILKGTISGGVDFTLITASDKKAVNANIDAKISAELSAGLKLKAKVLILKASAWVEGEASVSAKMGITSGHTFKYETYKGLFYTPTLKLDACIAQVVLMVEVGLSYKVISADWQPINYNKKREFWEEFDIIKKLEQISGISPVIQIIKP